MKDFKQTTQSENHLFHEKTQAEKYAEKCNFCAVLLVIRNCKCPPLYKKDEICVWCEKHIIQKQYHS